MDELSDFVKKVLAQAGIPNRVKDLERIGGGCINECLKIKLEDSEGLFLKWNNFSTSDMLEKERLSLELLNPHFKVPDTLACGSIGQRHFLLSEFIGSKSPDKEFWEEFGKRLAYLHQHFGEAHGLHFDNYIGRLYQDNSINSSWPTFFIQNRLIPQIRLAADLGLLNKNDISGFEDLFIKIKNILPELPPSLLHGDLWSGNFISGTKGCYLIDPAVYFGSREIEIAFTQLFGGFELRFYEAYESVFPLISGFSERRDIYNLYPLLVHLNLFGATYLTPIRGILRKFR